MRLKLALTISVCVLAVAAIGCAGQRAATMPETNTSQALPGAIPLAPDFRIADIPVPARFELDRDNSFVFQNPLLDVGRLQYIGREQLTDVAQFYIDEMPRYNWNLLNVAEHQTITLFFDKPNKSCVVMLIPKGRSTIVQISFYPKSTKAASAS